MRGTTVFIYELIEESTGLVIYVGRTRRHPKHREREHRRFYRDISEVRLCVLEIVPPSENPAEHERWWIRELERRGHLFLTNVRLRRTVFDEAIEQAARDNYEKQLRGRKRDW